MTTQPEQVAREARMAGDGHIDALLSAHPITEYLCRARTRQWIVEDFDRAIARGEIFPYDEPAQRVANLTILQSLRAELTTREAQAAAERAAEKRQADAERRAAARHGETIEAQFHANRFARRTFWLNVAILVFTVIAAGTGVMMLIRSS